MTATFTLLAGIFGFVGVALGAFGAHALRERLPSSLLAIFETAARYQMYHALALLVVARMWGLARAQEGSAVREKALREAGAKVFTSARSAPDDLDQPDYFIAAALEGRQVTPLEMAGAYATLAAGGQSSAVHTVREVRRGDATLTVPAGAVDGPVGITAATVDDFPAREEGAIVPGTVTYFWAVDDGEGPGSVDEVSTARINDVAGADRQQVTGSCLDNHLH